MEVRTFTVKFNRRSTTEVGKLGQDRFEYQAPMFLTFADLDLEALRDWIGETYDEVAAEAEVLRIVNGAVKEYARDAADPVVAVVTPKVYGRLSTFVAALVAAPDDEYRARLCSLNKEWAKAVSGVSGLVVGAAPTSPPPPPPVPQGKGKRR